LRGKKEKRKKKESGKSEEQNVEEVKKEAKEKYKVVSVAKHLCGGATDLTLLSLMLANGDTVIPKGVLIATCCHHQCTHAAYIDMQYLYNLGLNNEEIDLLYHVTSWATGGPIVKKGHISEQDVLDGKAVLSSASKRKFGFMSKRILDYGRIKFLRENGFKAKLIAYCGIETTPENVVILAHKEEKENDS